MPLEINSRYIGKIYPINIIEQDQIIPASLSFLQTQMTLFCKDWPSAQKLIIRTVEVQSINQDKKGIITLVYNGTKKITFSSVKASQIIGALSFESKKPHMLQPMLDKILGQCHINNPETKLIFDESISTFLKPFMIEPDISLIPFKLAYASALKINYNEDITPDKSVLSRFNEELTNSIAIVWCRAINRIISTNQSKNDFYLRLLNHCSDTLLKLSIPKAHNLMSAIIQMNESLICAATDTIIQEASSELNRLRLNRTCADPVCYSKAVIGCISLLCALSINLYYQDINLFALAVFNIADSINTQSNISALIIELKALLNSLNIEFLRYMDGIRYNSKYQFAYSSWSMMEDEKCGFDL